MDVSSSPRFRLAAAVALAFAGPACSPSLRAPTVEGPPPEYVEPAADAGPGGQVAAPAQAPEEPMPRLPSAPPPSDAGAS